MRSLGLYIHIPFCKAKCIYCDFYSLPRAEGQMDAYVSALTAQLAAWRERTADCTVDTVYFGGGTPSYLGPDCSRPAGRTCRSDPWFVYLPEKQFFSTYLTLV